MLFNWFNARRAAEVGTALADDFVLQSASAAPRRKGAKAGAQDNEVQKFLQKFLQRVDRDARSLELNVFKRAKLANSFKWRLLEKGIDKDIVDELTQALVMRLTPRQESLARDNATGPSAGSSGKRNTLALLTQGAQYLSGGAWAQALDCYQELVNSDPRNAMARNGLGIALARLGRYQEAEAQFRNAIGTRQGFPEAHFNLAGVMQSTGRFSESEMPLRRALKLKPAYTDAQVSLGMSLTLLGRLPDAKDCYEKALRSAPRNAQALVGMGQIESLNGHFDAAESAYQRALEAQPGYPPAWAALAWLRKQTPADAPWLKRAEEIAGAGLTTIDESTLRFAIGKHCDDVGDFTRAFRSYQRANELHKQRAAPYDREERSRFIDDFVSTYTTEALARPRAGASDSARPVFVVGMPRSGTSLVEQIIASHPAAHGAG